MYIQKDRVVNAQCIKSVIKKLIFNNSVKKKFKVGGCGGGGLHIISDGCDRARNSKKFINLLALLLLSEWVRERKSEKVQSPHRSASERERKGKVKI